MGQFNGYQFDYANSPPPVHTLRLMRADPASPPLDNVWAQAEAYKGIVHLAIDRLWKACASATPSLVMRRLGAPPVRKAFSSPGAQGQGDEQFVPVHNHAVSHLLRRPNPNEWFTKFLARALLQRCLHGRLLIWGVPNGVGAPCELYVLPLAFCTFVPISPSHPKGGWRVTPNTPGWAYVGAAMGGYGDVIPGEEVYRWDSPHALYTGVPYSPLTGCAAQIDLARKIDTAAWSLMENAPALSGIYDIPGANEDNVKTTKAAFVTGLTGPGKAGSVLFTGGDEREGKSAASFTPLTPTLDKSPLQDSRDWYNGFVLAVYGMTRASVGLKDTGSYAEHFADLEKVDTWAVRPFCHEVGQFFTHDICGRWFPGRHDYRIQVDPPTRVDKDALEKRIGDTKDIFTVNERRALAGVGPVDGGDVLSATYAAVETQQFAPPPPPLPAPGQEDQQSAPAAGPPIATNPQQNKPAGQQNGRRPIAPGGSPPQPGRPQNPAARGSLPPRMAVGKAMSELVGSDGGVPVPEADAVPRRRKKRRLGVRRVRAICKAALAELEG